ncbi:MAG: hypothetical protein NTW94_05375 [Legionellales bacterium]|nr:hypothetical protein [Legionellales bacterium]
MNKHIKLSQFLFTTFGAFALLLVSACFSATTEAATTRTTASTAPVQLAWWDGPYWHHHRWNCPKTCWQGRWGYWHCERRC